MSSVQQAAPGTSRVVKTGVAAGDMKATVEAMAGGLSPVPTEMEHGEGAAVAKADGGGPEEEEEVEGGGADDEDDDSPPRKLCVYVHVHGHIGGVV